MPQEIADESKPARQPVHRRRFILLACGMTVLIVGPWIAIYCYYAWNEARYAQPPELPYRPTPFVPTPHEVVDKMLELAEPKKDELLYDLGSGDGRIVVKAAKQYGCRTVGFEFNEDLVKKSLASAKEQEVEELVTIDKKDFYTVDLSKADVITIYLLPRPIQKLRPQLEKLRPGTRVVCHDYGLPWLTEDRKLDMPGKTDGQMHYVFLYVIKAPK